MHWAAYRHHPQGGLADHHCLFERAGLITQPECHWGGLISQLALVYSIYTYYHLHNNNYYHLIISQQQLTLSYYHTTKYHTTIISLNYLRVLTQSQQLFKGYLKGFGTKR